MRLSLDADAITVGGNRRRAAEKLGLDRRTIQRLIARYNLSAAPDEETDEAGSGLENDKIIE